MHQTINLEKLVMLILCLEIEDMFSMSRKLNWGKGDSQYKLIK